MNDGILRNLGEVSKKVIFSYDYRNDRFLYLSQAFEAIWERSREEVLQHPASLLQMIRWEDQQHAREYLQRLREESAYEEFDFVLLLPDKGTKIVRVEAYYVKGAEGEAPVIAGFAEDISRRRQYSDYLIKFATRKDSVLEIVSHDLRGPLAIVQAIAQALEKDHQVQDYEEFYTHTRLIKQACEQSINLINELLSDEHLRSPEIVVKKEWLDVVDKTRAVVETYQQAPNVSQTVYLETDVDQFFAELDAIKYTQIINNLISNALKFTEPDGKVGVSLKNGKREMLITVADNGIGIPAHLQPYLFDKYSKASRPGLRGEKSRGIGLSVVRELVEVQGGKIWCESQEKEGTTFHFSFPKRD
jgi:PAS domain S-box-containing protein